MRRFRQLTLILTAGLSALFVHCGTNTEQPVYPLVSLTSVGAPAITSVTPVAMFDTNLQLLIEYDLKYYITNAEDGFLGYNLYIRTASSAAEATVLGIGGDPYLPNGYAPSFPHVGATVNTTTEVTQRITHYKPPPGPRIFDACDRYYFRLTAVIRTGSESYPSPEISSCAITDTTLCPKGSVCNP